MATAVALSFAASVLVPSITETAGANGDTRTIHFYHTHTGERIDATFRVNGHYDPEVLRQLNHFLRDWRNNDETNMDPRLFDTLWEVYRRAGATEPIQIYSAYRSPETNAMLRRRSRAVAEHSQHMLGKAMDTTIPGFPMVKIREIGMQLQRGGVGWYPSANFVHLDVGGVRSWPRMPYDELARLFPDGKTVHIAANGQTLPGYEQARVELAERGETDLPPAQESGGFFAWLFGGGSNTTSAAREDEEDRRAPAAAPVAVARAAPDPQPVSPRAVSPQAVSPQDVMAYAEPQAAPAVEQLGQAQGQAAAEQGAPLQDATRVASLEQPADDIVLPMPPRRPLDIARLADIPLPPIRPTALSGPQTALRVAGGGVPLPPVLRRDPIGGLITATASGVPMLRRSRLPALITQGAGERSRLPDQALAFTGDAVASDVVPKFRLASVSRSRPASTPVAERRVASSDDVPIMSGPRLTGLRSAAHALAAGASQL